MRNKIKRPILTEKSSLLLQENTYTILTTLDVNKIEMKKYIEKKYSVNVLSLNTLISKPKKRRRGKVKGLSKKNKKVMFRLKDGDKIKELIAS
tara:strand:+ start:337 stop:615 length:279 start_codon:yes stop_codon:yes gene_type:complete